MDLRFGYFLIPGPEGKMVAPRDDTSIVAVACARKSRNDCILRKACYVDPDGEEWWIRPGDLTDGASIPRFFWRIWDPHTPQIREAAAFHDVWCVLGRRPSHIVHRMFYFALRTAGVGPVTAWLFWFAVRFFGPRFPGDPNYVPAKL